VVRDHIIEIARDRVIGVYKTAGYEVDVDTHRARMACLAARLPLQFGSPQTEEDLVADHTLMCMGAPWDSIKLRTRIASEPLSAEGARLGMDWQGQELFDTLRTMYEDDTLEPKSAEVTIVAALLLRAQDASRTQRPRTPGRRSAA
jgi:hypothetical protein